MRNVKEQLAELIKQDVDNGSTAEQLRERYVVYVNVGQVEGWAPIRTARAARNIFRAGPSTVLKPAAPQGDRLQNSGRAGPKNVPGGPVGPGGPALRPPVVKSILSV